MSMSPDEQKKMMELQQQVKELMAVTDVNFIANIQRRIDKPIKSISSGSAASITTVVSLTNVAKVPDKKLRVTLSDGSTAFIGLYTS